MLRSIALWLEERLHSGEAVRIHGRAQSPAQHQ